MIAKAIAHPNIAFIKYWGKKEHNPKEYSTRNIPLNPSISMTLTRAKTSMSAQISESDILCFDQQKFTIQNDPKFFNQLNYLKKYFNLPKNICYQITSQNNFPHGAGIASSASAYCALTKLMAKISLGEHGAMKWFKENISEFSKLSRLGSGSACRSIGYGFFYWQESYAKPIVSNWKLYNTVLVIDPSRKKTPSSQGHKSVDNNPLMKQRLSNIQNRIKSTLLAIETKNIKLLGEIIEVECLEMHKISQAAGINYLLPKTLEVLDKINSIKNRSFYYTIDAGPNIHLISEEPIPRDTLQYLGSNIEIWSDSNFDNK